MSKGDLTVKMETGRKDEVGELAKYFERMVDNLRMMILGVQETTEQVSASSQELSASAEQTTKAIEHSTLAIQELAEGAEQTGKQRERRIGTDEPNGRRCSNDVGACTIDYGKYAAYVRSGFIWE